MKGKIKYIYILIIGIILLGGITIYKSATTYNGKIERIIRKVQNEKSIAFENNNIYKDGVKGIFEDINEKYKLPEKLYISNSLSVKFKKDGTITYFETFIYGKNKNNKEKTYLIYYDKDKSKDIKLYLNGAVNADYSNSKILDPLFETVDLISIKDTVKAWEDEELGLLYNGKRNWQSLRDGIVLINKDGETLPIELASEPLIGYTVSIYVPGKEEITPVRYNLLSDSYWYKYLNTNEEEQLKEAQDELEVVTGQSKDEFYLQDGIIYKLNVEDKATGSFFYSLSKSNDGGVNWITVNDNPFEGAVGEAYGIYFINENIGFVATSRNSGCEGELYRTEDGGKSFIKLEFESNIEYFDYPRVPYEENKKLYLNLEQGADGDYNGNSSLLYTSKDKGKTWEYIKEVKE